MTPSRSIDVCTTREQLLELGPSWDRLGTFLDAPFGSFEWALSGAETLVGDPRLYIPVIREDGVPVALAALVRPRGFFAVARQLGVEDHGEPGDFNYRDAESLERLARVLAARHVPIVLARTPEDSPLLAALIRAYRRRGLVLLRPQPGCPFIEIEADADRTTASLPSRLRSDLRRAARKAEEIGAVAFEMHEPSTQEDLVPLWAEFLKVEAAGWKGRRQTALGADHRLGSFYRTYAGRAADRGTLRILFLKVGPDTAAAMIALEASERLWILKIGYDERFATCSPGMLLMHEGLRYAARRGLRSYEFLGSSTEWTRRWTDRERPIQRALIYPYTVRGAAILARNTAGHLARRLRNRLKGGMMLRYARKIGRPLVHEMVRAVSRDRVIGDNVTNAGTVGTFLHKRGYEVTLAYWNRDDDTPEATMARYMEAVDALGEIGGRSYVSIKAPAFGYDADLLKGLLAHAGERGVPLHFDAQGPQTADRTFSLLTDVIGAPLEGVGCTLPGRWQRSPDDAERLAALGLSIRVVKGEWADPDAPTLDPAKGYMEVVSRLAGRARSVRIATHDPDLARRSIRMLREAGTPCDLEFLYGFPVRRLLPLPKEMDVPIRVYVPFGHGWIPYCVGYVRDRPAFLWWLARDSLAGRYRNGFPVRSSTMG